MRLLLRGDRFDRPREELAKLHARLATLHEVAG
jgi:hypothetical protein